MSEMQQHRVAVTVIVDADGRDVRDAHRIAELAVEQTLAAAGEPLIVHTYVGYERAARVHVVCDIATALRDGALTIAPATIR